MWVQTISREIGSPAETVSDGSSRLLFEPICLVRTKNTGALVFHLNIFFIFFIQQNEIEKFLFFPFFNGF